MSLLGALLLVAVSVICAEREFFPQPHPATWDDARLYCQTCYADLTTITPANAEVISLNLTSDYWIGLRQSMNGSKFWSQWANGDLVLYQNWYPGHPVPKKKPEPQPTPCPTPPPAVNNTKTEEVLQCPAFAKLCECLNASGNNDEDLFFETSTMFNTTNNSIVPEMMWCPALAKLCACLNSSEDSETSIIESTTVFTTVPSPTPTMLVTTSFPTSTMSIDLEPEYIEDSCVALLSFGMWQEKQCNESLPYICYDERFYGVVNISNVSKTGGMLTWSDAGLNVTHYRVGINGSFTEDVINTSYHFKDLNPGTLYRVQVIPVKCERDLNAQNISFYTLPEEIRNLHKVSADTNVVNLSWSAANGTNVSYVVHTEPGNSSTRCYNETCSITNLQPGQTYNFTVKAVVNETIFGEPYYILACTKPSHVMNLTSSNNGGDYITAMWDSSDSNSLEYSYNISLCNITEAQDMCIMYMTDGSKTITLSSLVPSTKYTLTVSAVLPNCSEEGKAASITAYTTPTPVSNLHLDSTNNSIIATWYHSNAQFVWYNVTISSTMTANISSPTINTSNLTYTFTSLKSSAFYTVSIVTYVNKDLNPSSAVNESIYTRPTSPGNASAEILNNSAVRLKWEIPAGSHGVNNMFYSVKYFSDFWQDTGNLNVTGNNSVVIDGLKSGTNYKFNITVWAGNLESLPSITSGITKPKIRTATYTMLCSSSTPLYCMNNATMEFVLKKLESIIQGAIKDGVFWNLTLIYI